MSAQWLTPLMACHWSGSSHPDQFFLPGGLTAQRPRIVSPSAHKSMVLPSLRSLVMVSIGAQRIPLPVIISRNTLPPRLDHRQTLGPSP
jgi:hypothetical protein